MKKIIILIVLSITLFSCTVDDELMKPNDKEKTEPISPTEDTDEVESND